MSTGPDAAELAPASLAGALATELAAAVALAAGDGVATVSCVAPPAANGATLAALLHAATTITIAALAAAPRVLDRIDIGQSLPVHGLGWLSMPGGMSRRQRRSHTPRAF